MHVGETAVDLAKHARSAVTCRPRRKQDSAGVRRSVENVWGVGYRLVGADPDTRGRSAA